VLFSAGIPPISTVGEPGAQGVVVAGMHGIGVSTPSAAAVAAATVGLAGDRPPRATRGGQEGRAGRPSPPRPGRGPARRSASNPRASSRASARGRRAAGVGLGRRFILHQERRDERRRGARVGEGVSPTRAGVGTRRAVENRHKCSWRGIGFAAGVVGASGAWASRKRSRAGREVTRRQPSRCSLAPSPRRTPSRRQRHKVAGLTGLPARPGASRRGLEPGSAPRPRRPGGRRDEEAVARGFLQATVPVEIVRDLILDLAA
jgi:hypothetical protein